MSSYSFWIYFFNFYDILLIMKKNDHHENLHKREYTQEKIFHSSLKNHTLKKILFPPKKYRANW